MSEPILTPNFTPSNQNRPSPRGGCKTPPNHVSKFRDRDLQGLRQTLQNGPLGKKGSPALDRKHSIPEDELWKDELEMEEESDHDREPAVFVRDFEEEKYHEMVKANKKKGKRLSVENLDLARRDPQFYKPREFRPRMGSQVGQTIVLESPPEKRVNFKPTVEYNYYTPRPSFSELDSDFIDNVNIVDDDPLAQLALEKQRAVKKKKKKKKMFEPEDPDKVLTTEERAERTNLYLEEVFQILDKDMNNRLSLQELHTFCVHAYDEVSEDDVLHLSVQFGKEPMKGITFEEWVTVVKATDPDLHQFSDELYHLVVMTDSITRKHTIQNETVPWRPGLRQG